jgi:hypothetical protein
LCRGPAFQRRSVASYRPLFFPCSSARHTGDSEALPSPASRATPNPRHPVRRTPSMCAHANAAATHPTACFAHAPYHPPCPQVRPQVCRGRRADGVLLTPGTPLAFRGFSGVRWSRPYWCFECMAVSLRFCFCSRKPHASFVTLSPLQSLLLSLFPRHRGGRASKGACAPAALSAAFTGARVSPLFTFPFVLLHRVLLVRWQLACCARFPPRMHPMTWVYSGAATPHSCHK